MLEVMSVDRKDGRAHRVQLREGTYELIFALVDGRVKKVAAYCYGKQQLDGSRLWVPPAFYSEAVRRAYAILKPRGKKKEGCE